MKRLAVALLLLLVIAVPALARVVSYAAYTNKIALPGYHERTSRYFVLVEHSSASWQVQGQVVLYDSAGVDEPRVIYPQSDAAPIQFAALYESKTFAAPLVRPSILIASGQKLLFSNDGGTTLSEVGGLNSSLVIAPSDPHDVDVGGPFVRGLASQVLPGTDQFPFVLAHRNAVVAVDSSGLAHFVVQAAANDTISLIGRNAAGDRFLVRYGGVIRQVALNGSASLVAPADPSASYSGWITSQGWAYIQMLRPEGRFLHLYRDGSSTFVGGPYDVVPPPLGSSPQWSPETMRFFAVPTHDFDGAWMIQRQPGRPTALSRHTAANGVETMWADVSGPQVEALIPGASGTAVLVQVHRPRAVTLDRPFVDPALAVWHVGQPAPRAYDELYLNESWNKGFVHVDVDQMESGKPFVFNSGFQEAVPDIIVSPAPGGGDVIQEWGVVRASLQQRLVLPGVARLHGAFNSYWLTDVTMYNPLEEEQDVEVRFASVWDDFSAAAMMSKTLTLKANEIRLIPDALKTLFDIENGGGALHFVPASGISVVGRTYSRRSDGGTFGFGMQAIDFFNAAGPRFPLTFAGAFPGEHFRTNILLTDTSGRGSTAEMTAFGISGAMSQNNLNIAAPANGVAQYNGLGEPMGLFSRDAGGLMIQPTRGTMIPTVVAIDNRTNDSTYFPPDIPASVPRMIPVIGHLDGAFGSRFRSDLYLINPTDETRSITLEAKQWDSAFQKNVAFTMLPNEARVIPDALATLFGMTGVARLHFQTLDSGEGVRVTSRTYTIEESGATYGCLIPPMNNFQIASPGDRLEIIGVNAGSNFRANLGLVELTRNNTFGSTDVRISVIDDASNLIDAFTVAVPNTGGMQINDIFGSRGLLPPSAAMIRVENVGGNPGGLIAAYVTLTDNATNDSTFLGAQLGARPN